MFVPLFALSGIEGRLFTPLGIAYMVSMLASMIVSVTVTPVLCYYLLPKAGLLDHGDSPVVRCLKRWDARLLVRSFPRAHGLLVAALVLVALAGVGLLSLPRAFLPAFNEGTLTLSVLLNPGTALAAVSYTHLDVYKRQGADLALRPAEPAQSMAVAQAWLARHPRARLVWYLRL